MKRFALALLLALILPPSLAGVEPADAGRQRAAAPRDKAKARAAARVAAPKGKKGKLWDTRDPSFFGRDGGDGDGIKGGHIKNARRSTVDKHQEGDRRRLRDQKGEKGDARRPGKGNKRR